MEGTLHVGDTKTAACSSLSVGLEPLSPPPSHIREAGRPKSSGQSPIPLISLRHCHLPIHFSLEDGFYLNSFFHLNCKSNTSEPSTNLVVLFRFVLGEIRSSQPYASFLPISVLGNVGMPSLPWFNKKEETDHSPDEALNGFLSGPKPISNTEKPNTWSTTPRLQTGGSGISRDLPPHTSPADRSNHPTTSHHVEHDNTTPTYRDPPHNSVPVPENVTQYLVEAPGSYTANTRPTVQYPNTSSPAHNIGLHQQEAATVADSQTSHREFHLLSGVYAPRFHDPGSIHKEFVGEVEGDPVGVDQIGRTSPTRGINRVITDQRHPAELAGDTEHTGGSQGNVQPDNMQPPPSSAQALQSSQYSTQHRVLSAQSQGIRGIPLRQNPEEPLGSHPAAATANNRHSYISQETQPTNVRHGILQPDGALGEQVFPEQGSSPAHAAGTGTQIPTLELPIQRYAGPPGNGANVSHLGSPQRGGLRNVAPSPRDGVEAPPRNSSVNRRTTRTTEPMADLANTGTYSPEPAQNPPSRLRGRKPMSSGTAQVMSYDLPRESKRPWYMFWKCWGGRRKATAWGQSDVMQRSQDFVNEYQIPQGIGVDPLSAILLHFPNRIKESENLVRQNREIMQGKIDNLFQRKEKHRSDLESSQRQLGLVTKDRDRIKRLLEAANRDLQSCQENLNLFQKENIQQAGENQNLRNRLSEMEGEREGLLEARQQDNASWKMTMVERDRQFNERDAEKDRKFSEKEAERDRKFNAMVAGLQAKIAKLNNRIAAYNVGEFHTIADETFQKKLKDVVQRIQNLVSYVPRPDAHQFDPTLDPTHFLHRNEKYLGNGLWPKFIRGLCWGVLTRGFFAHPLGFGIFGTQGKGYSVLGHVYETFAVFDPSGEHVASPSSEASNQY